MLRADRVQVHIKVAQRLNGKFSAKEQSGTNPHSLRNRERRVFEDL